MNRLMRYGATILTIVVSVGLAVPARAQITQDRTLPHDSTISRQGRTWVIRGGTQRGRNLFHSFRDFSVPQDQTALFEGVDASVTTIFSRITGSAPSRIDGTIEVRQADGSISPASFFLINPNGVVFGPHAALNVGGAFIATTANSVQFADRTLFSAVEPQASLLTVSVPVGLQFGPQPGRIVDRSTVLADRLSDGSQPLGLSVLPQHTLALVGGPLQVAGGGVYAPAGRIELGSVGEGFVRLMPVVNGWAMDYSDVPTFGEINFSDAATIDASGATGGTIQVQGGRIAVTQGSQVRSTTLRQGQGGDVSIRAAEALTVDGTTAAGNPSFVVTGITSQGRAGNLTIDTPQLQITKGGQVATVTNGASRAGDLTVHATDIMLDGVALLPNGHPRQGPNGTPFPSGLFSVTSGSGDGGRLSVATQRLHLTAGASIQTTSFGQGNAGDVSIQAADSVTVAGSRTLVDASAYGQPSNLSPANPSHAGNVSIQTDRLTVQDNGQISANDGNLNSAAGAGSLNIQAQTVYLDQGSLRATSEVGNGGNIHVQVGNVLLLRHSSQIVSSAGTSKRPGNGGTIAIDAQDGFVVAEPSENNDIWANAYLGRGGRIEIRAQRVFGLEPLSLQDLERLLNTKKAAQLFPTLVPTSNIAAISQTSPRLNGQVLITSPDIDPSRSIIELPGTVSDASRQIAQRCRSTTEAVTPSAFIITGRGGLPPSPTDLHSSTPAFSDWATLDRHPTEERSSVSESVEPAIASTISEAQGWVVNPDGKMELVAQSPTVTLDTNMATAAHCESGMF